MWTPGNHELWTRPKDPVPLRGEERYLALVELCRSLGIVTPEDPYPVWDGPGGPVTIAPVFLLYDYTFRPDGALTKEQGLTLAYDKGIICRDEAVLHPDPYPSIEEWCWARIEVTQQRLAGRDPALPVVFVTHYPLVREPTRVLRYPLFAQWCGTTRTSDWHLRFNAAAVVYGHLHIPRVTWYDGFGSRRSRSVTRVNGGAATSPPASRGRFSGRGAQLTVRSAGVVVDLSLPQVQWVADKSDGGRASNRGHETGADTPADRRSRGRRRS